MDRNTQIETTNHLHEISSAISKLKNAEHVESFLTDLLTQSELQDVVKRWKILKLLKENKSQRNIAQELSVSLCKITRGAKILKNNKSIIRQTLFDESWRR